MGVSLCAYGAAQTRAHADSHRVGASTFRRRLTPLHVAASNGHKEAVAGLIALRADVDAKTDSGCVLPVVCFLTHTRMDGCMLCACVGATFCAYGAKRTCAKTCARAHADAHTTHIPTNARIHSHAGAATLAGVRACTLARAGKPNSYR